MIVDIVDKYLTDDNNPIKNLRLNNNPTVKWKQRETKKLRIWKKNIRADYCVDFYELFILCFFGTHAITLIQKIHAIM